MAHTLATTERGGAPRREPAEELLVVIDPDQEAAIARDRLLLAEVRRRRRVGGGEGGVGESGGQDGKVGNGVRGEGFVQDCGASVGAAGVVGGDVAARGLLGKRGREEEEIERESGLDGPDGQGGRGEGRAGEGVKDGYGDRDVTADGDGRMEVEESRDGGGGGGGEVDEDWVEENGRLGTGAQPVRTLRSGRLQSRDMAPRRRSRLGGVLDRLQDDLLVEVFLHLDQFPDLLRVRQVCRRWKALSCDGRLWRTLRFDGYEHVSSENLDILCRDTHGLRQLRDLSLAKTHGVSELAVRNIPRGECAATLEKVNLSWCSGANDTSVVEFSRCPGLRELRLSHCRDVSRRSVRIIAVRCPRLEVLDLNCIGGIRDSLLEVIGQNCPRLRELNIANARNVTDDGVALLASGCPRLEALDLSWCCKVTDWGISKIAASMPRLREVGLSETKVTNLGIAELTRHCGALEALHLARCVRISNEGAESIMKYCAARITTLNIASCHSVTDDCVERLIRACPRLNCLDVSKLPCRHIADMLESVVAVRDIQVYF